ncbi:Yip1 family protein [Archaeoglobus veneficus]|uniref:Yip1 domain-containing protein n=1 Tax=Archaeoglobus veneficus (strain DSM 11195 / SNP6) TaxID=693661 RepID=F2KQ70_ARCVS|nr:Yip1 family protein [Archaeoglobus veneficus]AEA47673.1 hypothetical protein Arcve_1673 [Archaeoglobus veneficus SNP6]
MLDLLFNPDEFFRVEKEQKFWRGFAIVLISAILASINGYLIAEPISESIYEQMVEKVPAEQARIVADTTYVASIISPAVGVFIMWSVIAAIFHGITAIFDGKGEFKSTLKLTAYSFVPSIALFPANFYITLENARLVEQYGLEALKSSDMVLASTLLGLAALMWQFTLWRFGIMHARNLDRRSATIVAALPALALAAISVNSLLNLRSLTP